MTRGSCALLLDGYNRNDDEMKSTKEQRKGIKIRQKKLGMTDIEYRGFLSSWGVGSCTQMNREQAMQAITALDKMMRSRGIAGKDAMFWASAPSNLKTRYEELVRRDARFATPRQLRYLEGLWIRVTRQQTWEKAIAAFRQFLQKRFHIGDILWIKREEVGRIANVLRIMLEKADTKID